MQSFRRQSSRLSLITWKCPRVIPRSSRQRHTRQLGADRDEAILKHGVLGLRVRGERTKVVEIAAGHLGLAGPKESVPVRGPVA
jgi:hypothetical protein